MTVPSGLLLCSDLDRTVLPNGLQGETPGVRRMFSRFVETAKIRLAYVTGRHLALVEEAIAQFDLPFPEFAITDVGTRIFLHQVNGWTELESWSEHIANDWHGRLHQQIAEKLSDVAGMNLQEGHKQSRHKLSYYVALNLDRNAVTVEIESRLHDFGIDVNLVWSVDETNMTVLLDILPRGASKLKAIQFLQKLAGYDGVELIFAGDSGNDLDVMESAVRSILVANASEEIKRKALGLAREAGHAEYIYISRGIFGMNGNYCAGILEGICHYMPQYSNIIRQLRDDERGIA